MEHSKRKRNKKHSLQQRNSDYTHSKGGSAIASVFPERLGNFSQKCTRTNLKKALSNLNYGGLELWAEGWTRPSRGWNGWQRKSRRRIYAQRVFFLPVLFKSLFEVSFVNCQICKKFCIFCQGVSLVNYLLWFAYIACTFLIILHCCRKKNQSSPDWCSLHPLMIL